MWGASVCCSELTDSLLWGYCADESGLLSWVPQIDPLALPSPSAVVVGILILFFYFSIFFLIWEEIFFSLLDELYLNAASILNSCNKTNHHSWLQTNPSPLPRENRCCYFVLFSRVFSFFALVLYICAYTYTTNILIFGIFKVKCVFILRLNFLH